jgi:aminoglycoside N3'-acetyltransferase
MTLEEVKEKLRNSIRAAKSEEQHYAELVRREGAARLGGSANATSMHLARHKAQLLENVLKDLNNIKE